MSAFLSNNRNKTDVTCEYNDIMINVYGFLGTLSNNAILHAKW